MAPTGREGTICCFTDGSCTGNGTPRAKGASAVLFPNGEMEGGAFYLDRGETRTNNKMELYAAVKAMELADEHDPSRTRRLHIFTDSLLLVNTCTKWMKTWQARGWKKSSPGEIKNLGVVKTLFEHYNSRDTVFTHVRAHQSDGSFETTWNNRVDRCACDAVSRDDPGPPPPEKTRRETTGSPPGGRRPRSRRRNRGG